jgi:hypothetical protein
MDFPDTKFLLSRLKPWTLVLLSVLVAPIANADSLRVLSQNMDRLFDNIDLAVTLACRISSPCRKSKT